MPKLKVYIETSVWSFAFADDAPNYRADTMAFVQRCLEGTLDTFISEVVLAEIERADEPLRTRLLELIGTVRPAFLESSEEATKLAEAFVREGAVPRSKPEDARHVAIAFAEELDVLASWNFRHIANVRRADRFNAIAVLLGYHHPLRLVSPAEVLCDEEIDAD